MNIPGHKVEVIAGGRFLWTKEPFTSDGWYALTDGRKAYCRYHAPLGAVVVDDIK
jgi:hypothetical protein